MNASHHPGRARRLRAALDIRGGSVEAIARDAPATALMLAAMEVSRAAEAVYAAVRGGK